MFTKILTGLVIIGSAIVGVFQPTPVIDTQFGATIATTSVSDTIGTFRTNVNSSLENLNTQLVGISSTVGTYGTIAIENVPLAQNKGGTGLSTGSTDSQLFSSDNTTPKWKNLTTTGGGITISTSSSAINLHSVAFSEADSYTWTGTNTHTSSTIFSTSSEVTFFGNVYGIASANFEDGSDGDITISATTTLTRDMYYNNLTINSGISLLPNGYRIFVKKDLTFIGTGKITANGSNGANGSNASANVGGGGGAGGALANATGTLAGTYAGASGSDGANGTTGTGNASDGGAGVGNSSLAFFNAGVLGGAGGNANRWGGGVGAGGNSGVIGTYLTTTTIRDFVNAYHLFYTNRGAGNITNIFSVTGSGGGGGGGGGTGSAPSVGGGGGGGGGAGASGGFVWVSANRIYTVNGNNYIEAKGGNGGNGGNGDEFNLSGGGGGGGGGGGSGGIIVLMYSIKYNSGTISVAGGTKGSFGLGKSAASYSGANGSNGTDGLTGYTFIKQY